MHSLPILFIPAFIWIALNAKRWGLFAEVPVDPEARVSFWASQALAHLKVELAVAREIRVEDNQLLYSKGKTSGRIWCAQGRLYKKEGSLDRESLGELGKEGLVQFIARDGALHIQITAQDGERSRRLEAALPLAGLSSSPEGLSH